MDSVRHFEGHISNIFTFLLTGDGGLKLKRGMTESEVISSIVGKSLYLEKYLFGIKTLDHTRKFHVFTSVSTQKYLIHENSLRIEKISNLKIVTK